MIGKRPPMPMSSSSSSSSASSASSLLSSSIQKQQWRGRQLALIQSTLDTVISPTFLDQLISCLHFLDGDDDDDDGSTSCNHAKRGKKHQHQQKMEIQIARLRKLRQLLGALHDALTMLLLAVMEQDGVSISQKEILEENQNLYSQSDPLQNDTDIDIIDSDSLAAGDEGVTSTTASDVAAAGTNILHRLDTIAIPMLDILQQEHWCTIGHTNQCHHDVVVKDERCATTDNNAMMIRRSLSYSCMEKAALTLTGLWKLRQRISAISIEMTTTFATKISARYREIIRKLVVPSLVSCAMALSSLDIAGEEKVVGDYSIKDDAVATTSGDVSSITDTSIAAIEDNNDDYETKKTNQRQSLDRGEDCAMAILLCVQSFLQFDVNGKNVSHDDDFDDELLSKQHPKERGGEENDSTLPQHLLSHEVGSSMGGALIARLVQGCLSLLSPMTPLTERKHENTALQLEALNTLQNLLITVPLQYLWRSILPGCFASLYRTVMLRLQSLSSSLSSPFSSSFKRIASESIRVLALLLDKSLYSKPPLRKDSQQQQHQQHQQQNTDKNNKSNDTQSITSLLMAAVKQSPLKAQLSAGNSNTPFHEEEEEDKKEENNKLQELKTEVNNRLVGPLLVLLSLLTSNCCNDVRKSGLHLCKIVMINIRTIWTESNYEALEKKSMEFCLMMMVGDGEEGDDDYGLKRCSHYIMYSFKAHHQCGAWKRKICQSIVPTILELMESLPAFARSGREMQVRHNLCLIQGYLLISFTDLFDESEFKNDWASLSEKMRKSAIRKALSCPEAVEIAKCAFSVLFAPDVDTMTCNTTTSIKSTLTSDLSEITLHNDVRRRYFRFLYLGDKGVGAATKTVHLLARVLGAKRCAFLIDDCFAEIFKSHSQSRDKDLLPTKGDIDRRRLWSGECIFVSELLRGISGPFKPSESTSMIHIFSSLASSVLPLIVSDPLWTLPTVLEAEATCDNIKVQSDEFGTSGWQLNCKQSSKGQFAYQSATMMNSNAVLISVMMGVIREFTLALGGGIRLHLPILLFPVMERASPIGNHKTVQGAAIATLQDISYSVGNNDISSLIASNFDYLVDVLSMTLRKYGRETMFLGRSCVGVVDLILRSFIYNRELNPSNGNCPIACEHVSMASNLLTCYLSCFDRQSIMTDLSVLDAARVLQSMCTFMGSTIDVHLDSSTPVTPEVDDYDWCQQLDFYLTAESTGHALDDSFHDDFPPIEPTMNDETELAEESLLGDSHSTRKNDQEETIFMQEIIAINTILSRCCYLLCYSNLQIQATCCETILSGFRSLGKIGTWRKQNHGESACNPLFRAIAEFWPPIIARLRSISANLDSVNRLARSDLSVRNVMGTDPAQRDYSQAGLEVLISKLLLVISELCMSSDGFFADRFEHDAYPIIATLLTNLLSRNCNNTDDQLFTAAPKQTLLLSILHCFKCTFKSECRNCLAGIIPAAGVMLLPLLAFRGPAGEGAADALKAMLMVDSDALWRELYNLSGIPFPCNPIFTSSSNSSVTRFVSCPTTTATPSTKNGRQSCDFILSQKALELLAFIECLAEQEL